MFQVLQFTINFADRIDFESADENMKKYGSVLMKHLPEKTTAFLKLLCTEYRPQGELLVDEGGDAVPAKAAKPGIIIKTALIQTNTHLIKMLPK